MAASPIPAPRRDWDEFFLLVNPAVETRAAVQDVAAALGCTPFECATAAQALEYLRQAQFLLVVCDESLPDGDWAALLTEVERLSYRLGMVVVSGSAECRRRVEELIQDGHDVALAQPQFQQVRQAVDIAAARWHLARVWAGAGLRKPASTEKPQGPIKRAAAGGN